MATKKVPAAKKAVKKVASKKPVTKITVKQTDFLGTWRTFRGTFQDQPVKQSQPSSWTILPGYKYQDYNGIHKCKIKGATIEIRTGATVWVGEMLPDMVLKISTENKMGSFYLSKKVGRQFDERVEKEKNALLAITAKEKFSEV